MSYNTEDTRADVEKNGAAMFLEAWSAKDASCVAKPHNSHEIFSVYSKASGSSFEETMMLAAQALLDQWQLAEQQRSIQTERVASELNNGEGLRALLRDKLQLNIGSVPRFVAEIYKGQAQFSGMNKREYFYHLLRQQGGDIPPYEDMDGRKL